MARSPCVPALLQVASFEDALDSLQDESREHQASARDTVQRLQQQLAEATAISGFRAAELAEARQALAEQRDEQAVARMGRAKERADLKLKVGSVLVVQLMATFQLSLLTPSVKHQTK